MIESASSRHQSVDELLDVTDTVSEIMLGPPVDDAE